MRRSHPQYPYLRSISVMELARRLANKADPNLTFKANFTTFNGETVSVIVKSAKEDDEILDDELRLRKRSSMYTAIPNPSNNPCKRCGGSGVEPDKKK